MGSSIATNKSVNIANPEKRRSFLRRQMILALVMFSWCKMGRLETSIPISPVPSTLMSYWCATGTQKDESSNTGKNSNIKDRSNYNISFTFQVYLSQHEYNVMTVTAKMRQEHGVIPCSHR
jgi:hypothetical protein